MVRIDCSGVRFFSPGDEQVMFSWGIGIAGAIRWEQDTLVMRSKVVSDKSLRELLALLRRYNVPMGQLAVFLSSRNEGWFRNPDAFWYKGVFGK